MKSVTIALCIQNCPTGDFFGNIKSSLNYISVAARQGVDIIVFPEMNLTGYATGDQLVEIAQPIEKTLIETFTQKSDQMNMIILLGLAELNPTGQIFTSHLVFTPGLPIGIYRKIHIPPNEQKYISQGNHIRLFSTPGINFSIQLCYDAHFPELATAMAIAGADILFIPHASPKGEPENKLESWMRHLTARGFDNGMFIAAVNQVGENGSGLTFPGLSLIIGPDGRPISTCLNKEEQLHVITLNPDRLTEVRSHKMRYFLPNRRHDLF